MSILPELVTQCSQVTSLVLFFLAGSDNSSWKEKGEITSDVLYTTRSRSRLHSCYFSVFWSFPAPCLFISLWSPFSALAELSLRKHKGRGFNKPSPDWQVQYFHLPIFATEAAAEPHCRVQLMDLLSFPAAWKPAFVRRIYIYINITGQERLITVEHSP